MKIFHTTVNQFKPKFQGSVLLAKGGDIFFHQHVGWADEHQPITDSTIFRIASITKSFVAAILVEWFEQNKLDLHTPLSNLSSLFLAPWGNTITPHQLLTHTSGIQNIPDYLEFQKTKGLALSDVVNWLRHTPITMNPGAFFYHSMNYILLTQLFEDLTQQNTGKYLKHKVFNPLQMHHTHFPTHGTIDELRTEFPGLSKAFEIDSGGENQPRMAQFDVFWSQGSGAMLSNAKDLLRWSLALFQSDFFDQKVAFKIKQPYVDDWGYGLRINSDAFYHLGYAEGSNALFAYLPKQYITCIILGNIQAVDAYSLGNKMMKALGLDDSVFRV